MKFKIGLTSKTEASENGTGCTAAHFWIIQTSALWFRKERNKEDNPNFEKRLNTTIILATHIQM